MLARTDMIYSASLGLSSQIPNCSLHIGGRQKARLQKKWNNKLRRSQQVKRERHSATARSMEATHWARSSTVSRNVRPCQAPPARIQAFAGECGLKEPRGRSRRLWTNLVNPWDKGSEASETRANQTSGTLGPAFVPVLGPSKGHPKPPLTLLTLLCTSGEKHCGLGFSPTAVPGTLSLC